MASRGGLTRQPACMLDVRARIVMIALVGSFLVVSSPPAHACSCAGEPAAEILASPETNAAFVGRLVLRQPAPDPVPFRGTAYRFEVESVVSGDLPTRIDVISASDGGACGIELEIGEPAGVVLQREDGVWLSNLCRTTDADELLAAGDPHPPSGPPTDLLPVVPPTWLWIVGALGISGLALGVWWAWQLGVADSSGGAPGRGPDS